MNARQNLKKSWEKLQETSGQIKKKVSGPVKDKVDEKLGIWIHKNIASLFIWDEHVQAWVFGGWMCDKCMGGIGRGAYNRNKYDKCKHCGAEKPESPQEVKGIVELAGTQEAVDESIQLKAYILSKSKNDRKYQKKLDDVSKKLNGRKGELMDKFEDMKESKFLKWLDNWGDE